jgi:uncharacterized protein (DUF2237 family)
MPIICNAVTKEFPSAVAVKERDTITYRRYITLSAGVRNGNRWVLMGSKQEFYETISPALKNDLF